MRQHPTVFQAPPQGQLARAQQGFTLIELIAIIIIIGILSAVLTTRYMSMTTNAGDAMAKGVVADGVGRFNLAFQQYLTDTGNKPTDLSALSGTAYLNLDGSGKVNTGDYDVGYSLSGQTLTVQAYKRGDATSLASATASWP